MGKRVNQSSEIEKYLRAEQVFARRRTRLVVDALCQGDVEGFNDAVEGLSDVVDGWDPVFRQLARRAPQLEEPMRIAFFWQWTSSKSLRLTGSSDRTTLTVLSRMMTPYVGPPLRLYRGASARTAQERVYGMS